MSALSRRLTLATATGAATLLLAAPALAHPSFNPNTVTVGERHTLDLVIPHGCVPGGGAPAEGEAASPTIAVSVKVPTEQLSFIAPRQPEGWSMSPQATSFTWDQPVAPTTEPITFQIDVEVSSDAGDVVYFTVAQDCEEGSTLWAAHEGEEGDPAALLFVGASTGTTEHDTDHGAADGEHSDMTDGEHADEMAADGDMDHAMDDAAAEAAAPASYEVSLLILVLVLLIGGIGGILKMDD